MLLVPGEGSRPFCDAPCAAAMSVSPDASPPPPLDYSVHPLTGPKHRAEVPLQGSGAPGQHRGCRGRAGVPCLGTQQCFLCWVQGALSNSWAMQAKGLGGASKVRIRVGQLEAGWKLR